MFVNLKVIVFYFPRYLDYRVRRFHDSRNKSLYKICGIPPTEESAIIASEFDDTAI
jgi:hypothetical protein